MIRRSVREFTPAPYTVSGLIKGTATLDELRSLFLHWRPGESTSKFDKRVLAEGVLSKKTAVRASDLIVYVFHPWFLTPNDLAAKQVKYFIERGGGAAELRELIFLYKARHERALYDFTVERFWPACHEGTLYLRTEEIETFLEEAREAGRVEQRWSPSTQRRLAHGILWALKDIGFLREAKRNLPEYMQYWVSDFLVAFLAHELHFSRIADGLVVEHPDWSLFGLEKPQVLRRLDDLDDRAGLVVQQAGTVVSLTWTHGTMEELLDAYAA